MLDSLGGIYYNENTNIRLPPLPKGGVCLYGQSNSPLRIAHDRPAGHFQSGLLTRCMAVSLPEGAAIEKEGGVYVKWQEEQRSSALSAVLRNLKCAPAKRWKQCAMSVAHPSYCRRMRTARF